MMTKERRNEIEREIVEAVLSEVLEAGYRVNIDNGGDTDVLPLPSHDKELILKAMFATGSEDLELFNEDGKYAGWVSFVYGNDGWDVIQDYTTKLEKVMTKANRLSEKYCDEELPGG